MVVLLMWQQEPHIRVHLIEHVAVDPTCQEFIPSSLSLSLSLSLPCSRTASIVARARRQRRRKTDSDACEIDGEASKIDRELAVQPP